MPTGGLVWNYTQLSINTKNTWIATGQEMVRENKNSSRPRRKFIFLGEESGKNEV